MFAATFFSLVVGGQSGEEVGWRGYALPRMAERLGLGGASVVLGVIWAVWHLPLFYILPTADTFHQSFPLYAVAIAWLYAHTRGSLLLTMLFHAAINNTKDIVPAVVSPPPGTWALSPSRVAWIGLALMWVAAGFFLVRMARVTRRESGARIELVRPPASP
jgi:membrane protease YdiL (CAAX protease family)